MKTVIKTAGKFTAIAFLFAMAACSTTPHSKHAELDICSVAGASEIANKRVFKDAYKACQHNAESGNVVAQKNLGYINLFGTKYAEPNKDEAVKWLSLAANNGNEQAKYRLELLEKEESLARKRPAAATFTETKLLAFSF